MHELLPDLLPVPGAEICVNEQPRRRHDQAQHNCAQLPLSVCQEVDPHGDKVDNRDEKDVDTVDVLMNDQREEEGGCKPRAHHKIEMLPFQLDRSFERQKSAQQQQGEGEHIDDIEAVDDVVQLASRIREQQGKKTADILDHVAQKILIQGQEYRV